MKHFTRRSALIGAAASAAAPSAFAAVPPALATHPGFRAWSAPAGRARLPLEQMIETQQGQVRLSQWLGRRPAVLALWASWCAPCLIEKPHQAALARRLAGAGASTRIFALQAYDEPDVELADARWMLDRIGAQALPCARATPAAEEAFRSLAEPSGVRNRTQLPLLLLIGGDGLEMGHASGLMRGVDGRSDYWRDEATFDFLSQLF